MRKFVFITLILMVQLIGVSDSQFTMAVQSASRLGRVSKDVLGCNTCVDPKNKSGDLYELTWKADVDEHGCRTEQQICDLKYKIPACTVFAWVQLKNDTIIRYPNGDLSIVSTGGLFKCAPRASGELVFQLDGIHEVQHGCNATCGESGGQDHEVETDPITTTTPVPTTTTADPTTTTTELTTTTTELTTTTPDPTTTTTELTTTTPDPTTTTTTPDPTTTTTELPTTTTPDPTTTTTELPTTTTPCVTTEAPTTTTTELTTTTAAPTTTTTPCVTTEESTTTTVTTTTTPETTTTPCVTTEAPTTTPVPTTHANHGCHVGG